MFSTAVTLSTPGGDKGFARLRMELSREDWAALREPEQLWVELPPESCSCSEEDNKNVLDNCRPGRFFQDFSSKLAPQLRQVTVIFPLPLGTRSCWPQLGHLK